jgi:hypothetical protein
MIDKIRTPQVLWSILKLWREELGTWLNDSLRERRSSEETISAVAEAGKIQALLPGQYEFVI